MADVGYTSLGTGERNLFSEEALPTDQADLGFCVALELSGGFFCARRSSVLDGGDGDVRCNQLLVCDAFVGLTL